jgi:hypothetical protein
MAVLGGIKLLICLLAPFYKTKPIQLSNRKISQDERLKELQLMIRAECSCG